MEAFTCQSSMNVPVETLFAWHMRPGALDRLSPPWAPVRLIASDAPGVADGIRKTLEIRKGPIALHWIALHRDVIENQQFVDEQERGPFKHWVHTHKFGRLGDHQSELTDEIQYELPLGPLGALGKRSIRTDLNRMFHWRHERTRRDVERHHAWRDHSKRRVLISGASGLVGRELSAFLTTGGHEVWRLVRRTPQAESEIEWYPNKGVVEPAALEGFDAIVNLSGENIAQRWDEAAKQRIRASRVNATRTLAEQLARLHDKPRVFISASATGFYGTQRADAMTENNDVGKGFLAETCREWEAAADAARHADIRVVHPRIGVVLSPKGGVLAKMLTPFKFGAGGVVGNGRQVMSWIDLDDLIGGLCYLIFNEQLEGPVNLTAPQPETNRDFTRTLGRILSRPTVAPLPSPLVKTVFGEMGEELLVRGARVEPRKLLDHGFPFLSPTLETALRFELGSQPNAT